MFKRAVALLLICLAVTLQGCVPGGTAGFKSFIDSTDGYQFLYPNGWVPVKVSGGPDVVFRDIIQETENVSVVISDLPAGAKGEDLSDLGSPGEVGYRLSQRVIAPAGSGREAELVNAESRTVKGHTYYLLEYAVTVNGQDRHSLASVAVSRGKVYTFNASTTEARWPKVQAVLNQAVRSFSVY